MFPRFALATSFLVVFTTTSVLSSLPLAVHAIDDTTTSFLSKQREEGVDNMEEDDHGLYYDDAVTIFDDDDLVPHVDDDGPSGLLRGGTSSSRVRSSSSSKNVREKKEMLPLDVFAMEQGLKKGSTLYLHLIDSTESIFVNNKMYSLEGLEEQEMFESLSSLTGARKFIGQNDDNDTITVIKDMEDNIQSIDIMTDDHHDGSKKTATFHLVAFEKDIMVMVNPKDSIDTNNNLKESRKMMELQADWPGWCFLCKHPNCQGGQVWKSVGWYGTMPWQVGNDALSRVKIEKGTLFHYWQHSNFSGWSRKFGSRNNGVDLSMGGHNDSVSSFAIFKL